MLTRNVCLLWIMALFFSCKDSYLDVKPQASLDENSLANPQGVFASLVATYASLDGYAAIAESYGQTGSNWIFGSVASDDALKGSEPWDVPQIGEIELFQWLPSNELFNGKFLALYEGIARANATLKLLARVPEISEEERQSFTGEALFLRAHFHFEAYKFWKNIPYYTELETTFRKPNEKDAIPYLLEDLIVAVEKLPINQEAIGRITRGAAQAYLGKVLLYNKEYASAKVNFDAVISSGKYRLQDCFHELFNVAGENGPEMIFAFQASINDGSPLGGNANPDVLNYPFNDGPVGCCGFHQPSQNLVNAFRVDENGLPLLNGFNDRDLADSDPVDPRLDWTVGRDEVPFLNWGAHQASWIRARNIYGPYSPKKNVYYRDAGQSGLGGGWGSQFSSLNIQLLRYADVLLMLAECEVALGNLENARMLVNQIRQRAANCAQGIGNNFSTVAAAIDDPAISWAQYRIGIYQSPWIDVNFALQAVRFERRLELAMEGHRFFDLRRWGIAKRVINQYLQSEGQKRQLLQVSEGYQDRHKLFPIPAAQVELSKINGIVQLKQNPGY